MLSAEPLFHVVWLYTIKVWIHHDPSCCLLTSRASNKLFWSWIGLVWFPQKMLCEPAELSQWDNTDDIPENIVPGNLKKNSHLNSLFYLIPRQGCRQIQPHVLHYSYIYIYGYKISLFLSQLPIRGVPGQILKHMLWVLIGIASAAIPMSTHNICFDREIRLKKNPHLIYSYSLSVTFLVFQLSPIFTACLHDTLLHGCSWLKSRYEGVST